MFPATCEQHGSVSTCTEIRLRARARRARARERDLLGRPRRGARGAPINMAAENASI